LIAAHLPLARTLARRYAGRGEPLDDLVQVGALGLIRASERFDADRGASFSTFAARVIDGEIRRHLRSRAGTRATAGDDTVEDIRDPDETLAASETRALVSRSVQALDDRERRIVFLRFDADMTERQIGTVLGISQAQVSRILNRALAKLRTELTGADDGLSHGDIAEAEVVSRGNIDVTREAEDTGRRPPGRSGRKSPNTVSTRSGGYSGRFLVRMPGELHEELARCAQDANVSLNRLVTDVLAASTSAAQEAPGPPVRREERKLAENEGDARTIPQRALRLAVAANLSLVLLTAAAAVILVVLALQRGI
jgi:RNA polymerase sigma-B factor